MTTDDALETKPEFPPSDSAAPQSGQAPILNDAAYKVDERRRTLRAAARYKGRIEISGYAFPVMTWDVSMGGARCSVQGVFPPNTSCTLYLTDDTGKEMPLPCKIVRSNGVDTRISFLPMKQGQKDFLTALTNRFTG